MARVRTQGTFSGLAVVAWAWACGTDAFAPPPLALPLRAGRAGRAGAGPCRARAPVLLAAPRADGGGAPPIYLDYSGTTPVDPAVVDAMLPYFRDVWGNPSSSHHFGRAAKEGLEQARRQVAASIGCAPHEVFFTSGGTESNNWALKGAVFASRRALQDHFTKTMGGSALSWSSKYVDQLRPHIVTTAVEHPAVLEPLAWLQSEQLCDVTVVPVGPDGVVKVQDIVDALRSQTVMVSVMHANNEVGSVQPLAEISAAVKKWAYNFGERGKQGLTPGVLVHSDACQTLGKLDVRVQVLSSVLKSPLCSDFI